MNVLKVAQEIYSVSSYEDQLKIRDEKQKKRDEQKNYYTSKDLKVWFKKLSEQEKQQLLDKMHFYHQPDSEKNLLQNILKLCRQIVRYDNSFENKNSEVPQAIKTAEQIQQDYKELLALVEQVEPKDMELVKDMLQILDHPWMRVLGDQLKNKDNLEQKLRDLQIHVSVKKKLQYDKLEKKLDDLNLKIYKNEDQKSMFNELLLELDN
jgi:hypothetical protein